MDHAGALNPAARALEQAVAAFVARYLDGAQQICVGLSGGPDSLALTAAAVRAGLTVRAMVVDHGLQHGSADVAAAAAATARDLGARAEVVSVSVGTRGGMEAAARAARYAALDAHREQSPVLLGHTMDDQAETVLLGLARGSGARSIAGMRPWAPPWGRPLLGIRRSQTVAMCTELGLHPHSDPHNRDPRFTRVRLRSEVIPLLEEVLGGGAVAALARTATGLRADTDTLDELAEHSYRRARTAAGDLSTTELCSAPVAIRTRVVRRWLLEVGATEPTARVIGAVDDVLTARAGGQVAIGGDTAHRLVVHRSGTLLQTARVPR